MEKTQGYTFREDHVEDDRLGNLFAKFKFSSENPRLSIMAREKTFFRDLFILCLHRSTVQSCVRN